MTVTRACHSVSQLCRSYDQALQGEGGMSMLSISLEYATHSTSAMGGFFLFAWSSVAFFTQHLHSGLKVWFFEGE